MKNIMRPGLLVLALAIPLCVGGVAAMLTRNMMKEYMLLNKPPLSPPGWMFPVVWTILYIMMGIASYLVLTSGADRSLIIKALVFYGIQLALNFFWSLLFFNGSLYLWALVELLGMWAMIIVTTVLFFRASPAAGVMMIPYILWSSFAAYLNFAVYKMSITPMPLPK